MTGPIIRHDRFFLAKKKPDNQPKQNSKHSNDLVFLNIVELRPQKWRHLKPSAWL